MLRLVRMVNHPTSTAIKLNCNKDSHWVFGVRAELMS